MKTNMVLQMDIDFEKIKEDIEKLVGLSASQLETIADFLSKGKNLIIKEEFFISELSGILRRAKITTEQFNRARKLCYVIYTAGVQWGDAPSDLLDDFEELDLLQTTPKHNAQLVVNFFRRMGESIAELVKERHIDKLSHRCLPFLTGVTCVCDYRLVMTSDYQPLTQSLADYEKEKPKVEKLIPIGIVDIGTDEDVDIAFQVTEKELDKMLQSLGALKYDLAVSREFFKKKKIGVIAIEELPETTETNKKLRDDTK